MPKRAVRNNGQTAQKARPDGNPRTTLSIDGGLQSPARRLQSFLDDEFHSDRDTLTERWSMRRTIAFVVVFCGLFWAAAAMLVRLLLLS